MWSRLNAEMICYQKAAKRCEDVLGFLHLVEGVKTLQRNSGYSQLIVNSIFLVIKADSMARVSILVFVRSWYAPIFVYVGHNVLHIF